jgi:hypothetical protein
MIFDRLDGLLFASSGKKADGAFFHTPLVAVLSFGYF